MKRLSVFFILALGTSAQAQFPQAEYAAHRSRLAAAVGNGILLAFGSAEPEQDYMVFNQNSPFYYLTGLKEPGAALVMRKTDAGITTTVFVEPRDPAREVWTGKRLGPEGAAKAMGIAARDVSQLRAYLDSLLSIDTTLHVIGNLATAANPEVLSPDDQYVRALRQKHPNLNVINVNSKLSDIRRVKSPAELDLIRKAVDISVIAQREAMRFAEPGTNEFEVQALIEYTFRRNGADRPSFSTIVGSGPNSTTLHYNADDRFMQAGEVVVMSFEDWTMQALIVAVWAFLGVGILVVVAVLLGRAAEIAFRIVGHPLGSKWEAFCARAEETSNRFLRPLGYLLGLVLLAFVVANLGEGSGQGCGWAGLMCEGSSEE